jgi:hypothetical protein
MTEKSSFDSPQGQETCLFSNGSRQILWPTESPTFHKETPCTHSAVSWSTESITFMDAKTGKSTLVVRREMPAAFPDALIHAVRSKRKGSQAAVSREMWGRAATFQKYTKRPHKWNLHLLKPVLNLHAQCQSRYSSRYCSDVSQLSTRLSINLTHFICVQLTNVRFKIWVYAAFFTTDRCACQLWYFGALVASRESKVLPKFFRLLGNYGA